jgi:hypothetical protein
MLWYEAVHSGAISPLTSCPAPLSPVSCGGVSAEVSEGNHRICLFRHVRGEMTVPLHLGRCSREVSASKEQYAADDHSTREVPALSEHRCVTGALQG